MPDVDLIFVDDGSSDGTAARLEALRDHAKDRIAVERLSENRGKGEAVRAGVLAALARDPAYVGYWDADLSTPLETALRFRDRLEADPELAVVYGARVALLGRRIERHAWRHYVGRVFATAVSLLLRLPIYDTQCGAKLFRAGPELAELFSAPFLSRWIFDVELVDRLARTRARSGRGVVGALYEYPVEVWCDVPGSKVGIRGYLRSALDLARLARGRRGG